MSGSVLWQGVQIASDGVSVWIIALVIAAFLASVPLGILFGVLVVGVPLGAACDHVNGAPFREGDTVCVLVGPHRGTITTVYEVWATRSQVRVCLGEQAKLQVKDVFGTNHVCRATPEQKTSG
ncbi:MAG: hypothetical protein NTW19_19245 [Planctomycetota bacterium]|nr:hypothetical protein [Planctomycetota bacterium]